MHKLNRINKNKINLKMFLSLEIKIESTHWLYVGAVIPK